MRVVLVYTFNVIITDQEAGLHIDTHKNVQSIYIMSLFLAKPTQRLLTIIFPFFPLNFPTRQKS